MRLRNEYPCWASWYIDDVDAISLLMYVFLLYPESSITQCKVHLHRPAERRVLVRRSPSNCLHWNLRWFRSKKVSSSVNSSYQHEHGSILCKESPVDLNTINPWLDYGLQKVRKHVKCDPMCTFVFTCVGGKCAIHSLLRPYHFELPETKRNLACMWEGGCRLVCVTERSGSKIAFGWEHGEIRYWTFHSGWNAGHRLPCKNNEFQFLSHWL